jgi:hypothetical protein
MATTAAPNQPRRRPPQPRVSVRAHADDAGHEAEYDLLTAALIGMTIGAGLTYMLRRGPSGSRPVSPLLRGIGRGAGWAGKRAAVAGTASGRWAADSAQSLWDRVPREEIRDHVQDYVGRAREAIDDAVETELRDLRKAIRRQRKRLGV